jgi:predicted HicB family RNase H-like nuclease
LQSKQIVAMQQKNNLYVMMLYTQKSKLVYSIMEKEIKPKQHQHQSESIILRLDSIILNKLQHEAEQKDTSVNALVTHIMRRHIDWHSNAAKAGFVTVRRGLLIDLINRLPDKEISSIAEYITKKETKDFVLLLRNEYNIESALDVIETWIKISGHPYRHEVNYSRHSYVIQHDMGKNWSLYMAEQYRFLFEEFELKRVEFDINDNTLDFIVDTEK